VVKASQALRCLPKTIGSRGAALCINKVVPTPWPNMRDYRLQVGTIESNLFDPV